MRRNKSKPARVIREGERVERGRQSRRRRKEQFCSEEITSAHENTTTIYLWKIRAKIISHAAQTSWYFVYTLGTRDQTPKI